MGKLCVAQCNHNRNKYEPNIISINCIRIQSKQNITTNYYNNSSKKLFRLNNKAGVLHHTWLSDMLYTSPGMIRMLIYSVLVVNMSSVRNIINHNATLLILCVFSDGEVMLTFKYKVKELLRGFTQKLQLAYESKQILCIN